MYVLEIPAGVELAVERHIYEEIVYESKAGVSLRSGAHRIRVPNLSNGNPDRSSASRSPLHIGS